MNAFAHLLDRLAYEPRRNAKLRMLQDYFSRTPDPERGYALGAMTGTLSFREAKPALIRGLVEERIDPVLFRLSHNYVGDLAETTALIWPVPSLSPQRREGMGPPGSATTTRRHRVWPKSSRRSARSPSASSPVTSPAGSMPSTRPGAGRS